MSAWSAGDWIFAVTFCLSVPLLLWAFYLTVQNHRRRAETLRAARRTEDDYATELKQRYQKFVEADEAELITCPVCLRSVTRGQMQRASVKQPTEPGKSALRVKQLVCADCIGSDERLVAGARVRRNH